MSCPKFATRLLSACAICLTIGFCSSVPATLAQRFCSSGHIAGTICNYAFAAELLLCVSKMSEWVSRKGGRGYRCRALRGALEPLFDTSGRPSPELAKSSESRV
jgi:hypothetical protein